MKSTENAQTLNELAVPFMDFMKKEFPEGFKEWGFTDEQWSQYISWHISTGNAFCFTRGLELIGFVLFRPMTKNMLDKRKAEFQFANNGDVLYVSLLVFNNHYRNRMLWTLIREFGKSTYSNIKYLAFEKFKDPERKLIIEELK